MIEDDVKGKYLIKSVIQWMEEEVTKLNPIIFQSSPDIPLHSMASAWVD